MITMPKASPPWPCPWSASAEPTTNGIMSRSAGSDQMNMAATTLKPRLRNPPQSCHSGMTGSSPFITFLSTSIV